MDKNSVDGKWTEIKGEIRKMWGDITGDELEQAKGNMTSISGLIQQKYGHKKEEVSAKLDGIMEKFGQKAVQKTDSIKQDLKKNNA